MIMFLLGVSVAINIVFIITSFVLYKSHKMKQFIKNTTRKDMEVWDF